MAPVVQAALRRTDSIQPIVCLTGQHREMLQQVTDYFGIQADCSLDLMTPGQSLAQVTARCVEAVDDVIQKYQPDCVMGQGDTTTVMTTGLAAFYRRVPFVHIEAGLRTGNLQAPWPEEMNRRIAALAAGLHCAPTERSRQNLLDEGINPKHVHVTGNTVIDALLWTVERERQQDAEWSKKYDFGNSRVVLITGHRRENFGGGFEDICAAIQQLASDHPDVQFVYPVHLNPQVQEPVNRLLAGLDNVHLLPPAPYPEFVWLMDRAYLILTDSGGVQEEAPSLKKPILVMRETTERPEAMDAGAVELVGTSTARIVESVSRLLANKELYRKRQIDTNPYGDGTAAETILDLVAARAWTA